jgi:hypothetical protein
MRPVTPHLQVDVRNGGENPCNLVLKPKFGYSSRGPWTNRMCRAVLYRPHAMHPFSRMEP